MPAGAAYHGRSSNVDTHSSAALLDIISDLKHELLQSRAETQRVSDQLTCLISLVKRAWTGDKTATLHLANIVGTQAQEFQNGGRLGHFDANAKTPAVVNWERMAIKLLERDYENVQREIQERQHLYMEGRKMYMEEILSSHQSDMSRFSLHKRSNSINSLEDVDRKFLRTYNSKTNLGQKSRPPSGRKLVRSKSAGIQRSKPLTKDIIEQAEMTLKELFIQPSGGLHSEFNPNNGLTAFSEMQAARQVHNQSVGNYDDPHRYTKSNLFDLDTVFGSDSSMRKTRPASSAFLKERDAARARPKSAGNVFLTQKSERPLKYETTRPIPLPKGNSKSRHEKSIVVDMKHENNTVDVNDDERYPQEQQQQHPEEQRETTPKPPKKTRINSAAIKRPECIDRFDEELQQMSNMEEEFRRTTLQLQKKLGISDKGILY